MNGKLPRGSLSGHWRHCSQSMPNMSMEDQRRSASPSPSVSSMSERSEDDVTEPRIPCRSASEGKEKQQEGRAMATLDRKVPSPEAFLGKPWSTWIDAAKIHCSDSKNTAPSNCCVTDQSARHSLGLYRHLAWYIENKSERPVPGAPSATPCSPGQKDKPIDSRRHVERGRAPAWVCVDLLCVY